MLPTFTPHYQSNQYVANPVFAPQLRVHSILDRRVGKLLADLQYLSFRQLVCIDRFAVIVAQLRVLIAAVVSPCARKQMVWPNAFRVIALVANNQAFRHFAKRDGVRHTMSANGACCADGEAPVSVAKKAPLPFPALVGLADVRPKASNVALCKLKCFHALQFIRNLYEVHFELRMHFEINRIMSASEIAAAVKSLLPVAPVVIAPVVIAPVEPPMLSWNGNLFPLVMDAGRPYVQLDALLEKMGHDNVKTTNDLHLPAPRFYVTSAPKVEA